MPLKITFYFLYAKIMEGCLRRQENFSNNSSHEEQWQEILNFHRALQAFDNYMKSLSQIQFQQRKFSFSYYKAFGLTEEMFHKLMEAYDMREFIQLVSNTLSIYVPYAAEEGRKTKTIFLSAAIRAKKYDVLVAKASSSVGMDWIR